MSNARNSSLETAGSSSPKAERIDEDEQEEDLRYLKTDNRGTRAEASNFEKYNVDRNNFFCGSFGCSYRLSGRFKGTLLKMGLIQRKEYDIAARMGDLGIGPAVSNNFMTFPLFVGDEPLVSAKTGQPIDGHAFRMEAYDADLTGFVFEDEYQVSKLKELFIKCLKAGVMHCDLSAANVVYRRFPNQRVVNKETGERADAIEFRLIDFGFSRELLLLDEKSMQFLPPYPDISAVPPVILGSITFDWLVVVQKFERGRKKAARNEAMLRDVFVETFIADFSVATRALLAFGRLLEKKYSDAFFATSRLAEMNFPNPAYVVRQLWSAPEEEE